MINSSHFSEAPPLRCGCRESSLSLIQSESALAHLRRLMPFINWKILPYSSPGDRDRRLDLRESPGDFFSRDLDEAVRSGKLDSALHSAKDLPQEGSEGIDWFWLPWREDPRDALIMREGDSPAALSRRSRIGVSSDRRHRWCAEHYPAASLLPIRGNIESRLAQLDSGDFDAVIMAAAALNRLNLSRRITQYISLSELPTPPGQGYLALTFAQGNRFFQRMRALLLPPVRFVGAGAGEAGWITERGGQALTEAGVCLHDALIDIRLLLRLPADCERVPVGKRRGAHSRSQDEICALIAEYARRGRRLVRLKGGDPGIFGRLSEELAVLDQMGFPHLVYPGLSALSLATTGTGLFLTKRGKSRGFRALTPKRSSGHESVPTAFPANEDLPAALFMSLSEAAAAREHFLKEGLPPDTDCAVVYDAGTAWEEIRRCPLNQLGRPPIPPGRVGLILLNPPEGMPYRRSGPLAGDRVLLTCSEELLDRARAGVEDAGGRALLLPLIRQELIEGSLPSPEEIAGYDWVILTSPTAIRLFLTSYRTAGGDYRQLPKIMVCGSSSAAVLAAHGLKPDLIPPYASDSQALAESAKAVIQPGQRILRLRSDAAGTKLTEALSALGAEIEDVVFYRTAADTSIGRCPSFEAVFFASSSAVRAYLELWGIDSLADKTILTIGRPTRQTLESLGLKGVLTADQSDARGSIAALAIEYFRRKVEQYGFS